MRITTKGRYALRALTNLALSDPSRPVPIKKIAADEDISPEFLEQIFFKLKKSGIISSVRGPGGGFLIARDPKEVTLRMVFEAVDEGIAITPCTDCSDDDDGCPRQDFCIVYHVWKEASEHILSFFDTMTLQKIVDRNADKSYAAMIEGEEFSVN